jgi:hypothetical protein
MDYHVFLLSRIREHFLDTDNNTESVAFGVRSTAGIITGAALIMASVFGGFALGDLVMFQQMGFGVAVVPTRRSCAQCWCRSDAAAGQGELVPAGLALAAGFSTEASTPSSPERPRGTGVKPPNKTIRSTPPLWQAGRRRWAARFALCATVRLTGGALPVQLGKTSRRFINMPTILHTADVHLDRAFAGAGMTSGIAAARREELRDGFRRFIDLALELRADAVTIGGDLYEHERSTLDTGHFLRQQFERLGDAPAFIAPGNHDPVLPDSLWRRVDWPANVTIFTGRGSAPRACRKTKKC